MSSQSRNALVGLFVLGALLCLGAFIVKFSEDKLSFGKSYVVKANFDNISGVRAGTQVDLAGKAVGRVLEVEFADPDNPGLGVTAYLDIRKEYRIPERSTVQVAVPIMGQPKINIQPPSQEPGQKIVFLPQDGSAELFGTLGSPLDDIVPPELMDMLVDTVAEVRTLAGSLIPAAEAVTDLLERRTIEQTTTRPGEKPLPPNMYTAIQRLDLILQDLHTVIGDLENQHNIKETLANMTTATANIADASVDAKVFLQAAGVAATQASNVLDNVNGGVTTLRTDLKQLAANLNTSTAKLSQVLDNVLAVSQNVADGQGTLGMLLKDPKFYEELLLTAERLSTGAQELNILIKQWQQQGLLGAAK